MTISLTAIISSLSVLTSDKDTRLLLPAVYRFSRERPTSHKKPAKSHEYLNLTTTFRLSIGQTVLKCSARTITTTSFWTLYAI